METPVSFSDRMSGAPVFSAEGVATFYVEQVRENGCAFLSLNGEMRSEEQLVIEALRLLTREWPGLLTLGELEETLTSHPDKMGRLAELLLEGFTSRILEIRTLPLACAQTFAERPRVNAVVRQQARQGAFVTNAQHVIVRLPDETAQAVLQLADGSRTHAEPTAALHALLPTEPTDPGWRR